MCRTRPGDARTAAHDRGRPCRASAFPGRHQRRARGRRAAGIRADPDLGARRRPDRIVRHRHLRRGCRGSCVRRRQSHGGRRRARRHATRRVDRRRALAHGVGRDHRRRGLVDVMRRTHEAAEAVETYSPAEARFNRLRSTAGLIAGPLVFAVILFWPAPHLPPAAHRLAAILGLMITFWMTEALPLPVTALIGPTLAFLLGVAPLRAAFAPFADPIIFLFIGSFMLAEAMFVHGLDRRLAFSALGSKWVGESALRLVVVYAAVTCVLSMWMSNTATTAMLFPLGLAILAELGRGRKRDRDFAEYAMAMMLVTSFAASIGGMGTPVGTPPNLIGKGFLQQAGVNISFAGWMALCVPLMLIIMGFVVLWLLVPRARHIRLGEQARRTVLVELEKLGPVSRGERNVITAFAVTVGLWVLPGAFQLLLGQAHPVS